MEIKHKELIPDNDNPFAYCKLDRAKYASVLTKIVETYADGFVLAIDGKWGTGKTTFVRMWEAGLKKDKFKTIYFNAWENDFENEPLVALMGEIKNLIGENDEVIFADLLKKGSVFTKKILPVVVKGLVKKQFGEDVAELFSSGAEAACDLFEEDINDYLKKKKSLHEFKTELEKYISKNNNGKPVVIIIDELDRCRPDYAVEVLEKVKHFFSVKGIVFVLSIDKIQLGHSIKGYYGNDNIDANEYLRRFVDLEYQLPEPLIEIFCRYLYEYFEYNTFFKNPERGDRYRNLDCEYLNFAIKLFENSNYTLRRLEKFFALGRIVINSFSIKESVYPETLLVLLFLKQSEPEFYYKIQNRLLSIQEFVISFESVFESKLKKTEQNQDSSIYVYVESMILIHYAKYLSQINRGKDVELYEKRGGDTVLTFNTEYEEGIISNFNQARLQSSFYSEISIDYIMNKINLTDSIM